MQTAKHRRINTMKKYFTKIIVPLLCISLLISGCASIGKNETENKTSTETTIMTDNEQSIVKTADQGSAQATTSDDASSNKEKESNDFANAFSERDLSGEYDSNVTEIKLTGSGAEASADTVNISGSTVTVTGAGTYILSGTLKNGSVIVDAAKDDKIQLVLNGVDINSDTYASIYVKQADKVFITLADGSENTLSNGGSFTQTDDNDVDAVVFAKDDITLNGSGKLTVTSPSGHGIVGKDEVTVTGGTYGITAAETAIRANDMLAISDGTFTLNATNDGLHSENNDDDTLGNIYITGGSFNINVGDDAIHANALLRIDDGSFEISAAEGLEATYITVNGGTINISASDDGVNAAHKSDAYTPAVEINGGDITIVMGAGDTDGVDSNGNIIITGGTINITGQSAFDYDGQAQLTGGTLIVNGQQVDSIPNQMMGGGMGGMNGGMNGNMGGMNGGMQGGPGGMQGAPGGRGGRG